MDRLALTLVLITAAALVVFGAFFLMGQWSDEGSDLDPVHSSTSGPHAGTPVDLDLSSAGPSPRRAGGAALEGRLVDELTRRPVPGAPVVLKIASRDLELTARSGRDGSFRFTGLPTTRDAEFWVTPSDYAPTATSRLQLDEGRTHDLGEILLTRGVALEGTVTRAGGGPLEGAQVYLVPHSAMRSKMDLDMFEVFDRIFDRESAIVGAETDGEGRYSFPRVATGDYVVAVYAMGFQARYSDLVNVHRDVPGDPVDVELAPGHNLEGVVVDESGAPLPGVQLAVLPERGRRELMLKTIKTITDETGSFRFFSLGAGPHTLFARRAGLAPAGMKNVVPGAGNVRLTLTRGCRIHGRVFDRATGHGLPGTRVAVMGVRTPVFVSGLSGPDGRYELIGVPALPRGMIIAQRPGCALHLDASQAESSFMSGLPLPSKPANGTELVIDLPLDAGATLRGRVVSAEDGKPLAGVEIRSLAMSSKDRRTARRGARTLSGPDGRFELTGLTPGTVTLRVFPSRGLEGFYTDVEGPVVTSGEVVDGFEVTAAPAVRVRGTVFDEEGRPLAQARVSYRYARAGGEPKRGRVTLTDDLGVFRLKSVPADAAIILTARHDTYACAAAQVIETARSDVSEVEIRMTPGSTLRGRLVDPQGRAVPDVMVSFASSGPLAGRRRAFDRTDDEGRFVLDGLPEGRGRLLLPDTAAWRIDRDGATVNLRAQATVAVTFEVRPAAVSSH